MSVTIDSTNPRIIADNIRKLDDAVQSAASEIPEVETTDEGKVLTVNASGKWAASNLPPYPVGNLDYSTTEQDTGLKWIDGKEVYTQTLIVPEDSTTGTEQFQKEIEMSNIPDEVISIVGIVKKTLENNIYYFDLSDYRSANDYVNVMIFKAQKKIQLRIKFSDGTFGGAIIQIYFTKPTETREPDEEPELKKVTRKKSTTNKEEE